MIRRTLSATQDATFCVQLPSLHPAAGGLPVPTGTGFVVADDGWFVTARHVVAHADGSLRSDVGDAWLMKEMRGFGGSGAMCQWPELVFEDAASDLALLKVAFSRNANKDWLSGREGFPHLTISARALSEGEPVYSFGYPLSTGGVVRAGPAGMVGAMELSPRVTSAIVASTLEKTAMVMSSGDPLYYVLDKALNYGNSGGPVIASETGHVHAFCSRFQPVGIPQHHLLDPSGKPLVVYIPSLYGVVSSLANAASLKGFREQGVPISEE